MSVDDSFRGLRRWISITMVLVFIEAGLIVYLLMMR